MWMQYSVHLCFWRTCNWSSLSTKWFYSVRNIAHISLSTSHDDWWHCHWHTSCLFGIHVQMWKLAHGGNKTKYSGISRFGKFVAVNFLIDWNVTQFVAFCVVYCSAQCSLLLKIFGVYLWLIVKTNRLLLMLFVQHRPFCQWFCHQFLYSSFSCSLLFWWRMFEFVVSVHTTQQCRMLLLPSQSSACRLFLLLLVSDDSAVSLQSVLLEGIETMQVTPLRRTPESSP